MLATAGGPGKVAEALGHGVEVPRNSRAEGFDLVELGAARDRRPWRDVVFDPVGGDLFDASRRVVAFEGRYVVIGNASLAGCPSCRPTTSSVKNYVVLGLHFGLYRTEAPEVLAEALGSVMDLVATGRLSPAVGDVHPFEAAQDAVALAAGTTTGKQVVEITPGS